MIPKNIALAGPDRAALVLGPPIWAIVTVLRPVIVVINASASVILRLFGVRLMDEVSSTYTREEVAALVEESRGEGLIEPEEYDRLAGALGFTEKPVSTVLMPPETLTTVARGSTAADVEARVRRHRLQPVPGRSTTGELLGYLHIKDVLETDEALRQRVVEDKWIRPFAPVSRRRPAARRAGDAAAPRRAHGRSSSTATGATLGLATLEDVIEELVGEIRDAAHLDETGVTAPTTRSTITLWS